MKRFGCKIGKGYSSDSIGDGPRPSTKWKLGDPMTYDGADSAVQIAIGWMCELRTLNNKQWVSLDSSYDVEGHDGCSLAIVLGLEQFAVDAVMSDPCVMYMDGCANTKWKTIAIRGGVGEYLKPHDKWVTFFTGKGGIRPPAVATSFPFLSQSSQEDPLSPASELCVCSLL